MLAISVLRNLKEEDPGGLVVIARLAEPVSSRFHERPYLKIKAQSNRR